MLYILIIACIIPVCITMFVYQSKRKREFDNSKSREALFYNLQADEFYSIKRSKSALKKSKSSSSNSRKSVQFNEVVLEVFDLINDETDESISNRFSNTKIVKSSLKNEKECVPVRCSNTIFPKTIINEYSGEIINIQNDIQKNEIEETKFNSNEKNLSEILIIKENEDKPLKVLSHTKDTENDVAPIDASTSGQINDAAKKVITSEANTGSNLINNNISPKSNTLPRRSRPSYKGHRRQSSVRLKCIY